MLMDRTDTVIIYMTYTVRCMMSEGADLAHVPEILQSKGFWNAAAPLKGITGHDRAPLHVIHHQQHLITGRIVYHFLSQQKIHGA